MGGTNRARRTIMTLSRPRKVLILMSRHGLWGDEINLLRLLPRLDRTKIEPLVLLPDDSDDLRDRLAAIEIETWQRTMPAWRKPKAWPGMALYLGEIVWEIYKRRIDIVLALNVNESPAAVLAGWLSGRPSAVWFQDSLIAPGKARSYLLHRADAVAAISEYMRGKVQQVRPKGQIEVVYNGVDPEQFDPRRVTNDLRTRLNIAPNELVLGMAGRIMDLKGQRELIQALPLLKEKGLRPKVLLAGTAKEDYREAIEATVRNQGLTDQVHFLGFQPDIARVLAAIDIFVLLSLNESFSIAMAEAMAMEKPCIYTPVGGVRELAGEEQIGLAVDRSNPGQIAEAILQLAGNPEKRAAMGKRGRARILDRFTLERPARGFEAFLTVI
jgi:glycosyltransferase involved in cell wall biosynthesis